MADFTYSNFKSGLMTEQHNLTSDTLKVALVSGTYTPTHSHTSYTSNVASHEVAGSGYTVGGVALTSKVLVGGDNYFYLDADNVSWNPSTITASGAVVYNDTHASKALIAYIDLGQNRSSTNGNFQLTWSANGIVRLSE